MNKKIKDQFAVLYVQAAQFHPICSNLDWPKSLKDVYMKHQKKIDEFSREHFPKEISIIGFCEDEDISHYDIDDAIRKNYPKSQVQTDSESSQFYCYTSSQWLEDVKNYLKENYPSLGFSVSDDNDNYITPFANWGEAEEYVKKNNIEIPPIYIGADALINKLDEFDSKIKQLEKDREEYLKNIK